MPFWEAVLKVGGSLCSAEALPRLMHVLAEEARHRRLIVVPGGGPFAETVRSVSRRKRLGMRAAHQMAILAMDQYGMMLCDLDRRAAAVRSIAAARRSARTGRLPVLLVSHLAGASEELPASWDVTSDSIAAWIAGRIGAPHLILLKSVAPPPRTLASPRALARHGIVDRAFPMFARGVTACWVVNGRGDSRARRLTEILRTLKSAGERRDPRRADAPPDSIPVAGRAPDTHEIGRQRAQRREMLRPQRAGQRA